MISHGALIASRASRAASLNAVVPFAATLSMALLQCEFLKREERTQYDL